ncbi:MAG TPA: hypothetical protein VMZ53_13170 [Kofleriaceae bacterium]|nr:hypothetical protein [Kofleriaceae bacterium]
MKAIAGAIVVAVLVALASGASPLPQQATNTLTAIDTVPTRQQIDQAFINSPQTPLQNLSFLATDTDAGTDIGVRLRAIHALAKYCTSTPCLPADEAHQTVRTVVAGNAHELSGPRALILRAGIETLGAMRVGQDADFLVAQLSLLDHPSRDIRASTARALAELCSGPSAVNALRLRYSHELTEQVKLAISEALRILGQCTTNP